MKSDIFLATFFLVNCIRLQAAVPSASTKQLFTLSFQDLEALVTGLNASSLDSTTKDKFLQLKNALRYEGAVSIDGLSSSYSTAVRQLKTDAPDCLRSSRLPAFTMADGSLRTTFASSTDDPQAMPACLAVSGRAVSRVFDDVFAHVSHVFEHVAGGRQRLSWREPPETSDKNEEGSNSFNEYMLRDFSDLHIKEHVHVYTPPNVEDMDYVAPFHVDNGILLLITPFKEHPLQIKSLSGEPIATDNVGDDSVILVVARGLPSWLLGGTGPAAAQFHAAQHAVPSLDAATAYRTVYARMMVAPLDSLPGNPTAKQTPFSHVFFGHDLKEGRLNPVEELCPPELHPDLGMEDSSHVELSRVARAHEKHEKLKKDECSNGTSYCWMNCLNLDPDCSTSEENVCTNDKDEPCCTDKSQEGTGTCADMDMTCKWKCSSSHGEDDSYCTGGTDMYMRGFQTSKSDNKVCIILFFDTWVLDTKLKFAFGCVGVIFLGILVEALLCIRRLIQSRKILRIMSAPLRRGSIIVLFFLNIALGYLAMLVAMTYSVELFLCMVVGLVLGHAIFNTSAPVGESVDPCCASQVIGPVASRGGRSLSPDQDSSSSQM